MPGFPSRDLALVDPWEASYDPLAGAPGACRPLPVGRGRGRRNNAAWQSPPSLSALLGTHRQQGADVRDLAETEPWDLSLGRSRARRRAEELRFVPTSTRAKRISLGALVALAAGPSASMAEGSSSVSPSAAGPAGPTTTRTQHRAAGRQRRPAGAPAATGAGWRQSRRRVRPGNRGRGAEFQASRGLTVDGVVGPLTSAALRTQTAATATLQSFDDPVPGEASSADNSATAATAAAELVSDASSTQPGVSSEGAAATEGAQDGTGGTEASEGGAGAGESTGASATTASVDTGLSSYSPAAGGTNAGTGAGSAGTSASSESATWMR